MIIQDCRDQLVHINLEKERLLFCWINGHTLPLSVSFLLAHTPLLWWGQAQTFTNWAHAI